MKAACACENGRCSCRGVGPSHRFVAGIKPGSPPTTLNDAVEILRKRGLSDDAILTAIGKAVGFDFKKAGFIPKRTKHAALMARASKGLTNTPTESVRKMMGDVSHELRILAKTYRAKG